MPRAKPAGAAPAPRPDKSVARLGCLRLAVETRLLHDSPANIIARARAFEAYVLGDNHQAAPAHRANEDAA